MSETLAPRAHVLRRIQAFLAATGMSERRLGLDAVHTNKFVSGIRTGRGTTLAVIERAEAYMQADLAKRGLPDLDTLSRS